MRSKRSPPIRGHGGHLGFPIGPRTPTWQRTLISCFLSSFVEFRSAVTDEKSKMSRPIDIGGQDGYLCFSICSINTNLIEDVEILLPGKLSLNVI